MAALRMRPSRSAIGSVIMRSPARLGNARHLALQGEQTEAETTQPEVAVHRARTAANLAAVHDASRELGGTVGFGPLRSACHLAAPERHAEIGEELFGFLVGVGGCDESDVHALDLLDLVEVDLREDDLLFE